MPTCTPAGTIVPLSEGWVPTRRYSWYSRSENSARLRLKPVVVTFAMLFAITSMFSCWAAMPVAAVKRERMIGLPLAARDDVVDGALHAVVLAVDKFLHGFVAALHPDHGGQFLDRLHVGLLQHSLDDGRLGHLDRRFVCGEHHRFLIPQRAPVLEVDDVQLAVDDLGVALLGAVSGDAAVTGDL